VNATHFASPARFRRWLEKNHATAREVQIAFYKKSSGKSGMTYPEAVDEALCFGWIDGVMHPLDRERYALRFTPRRPGSTWSNINVGHVARLEKLGKMHPAGRAAFAARLAHKTGIYSFEAKAAPKLPLPFEKKFRTHKKAWTFFAAQPPGYRRTSLWHILNAKQLATRARRLDRLIAASHAGRRV
jgi:uncharacterized protein YdeI (YjbR/CyaY-like superfamily)